MLMIEVFIAIKVRAGKLDEILMKIKELEGVELARSVTGRYDIISLMKFTDIYAIEEVMVSKIRKIDGVIDTESFICLR